MDNGSYLRQISFATLPKAITSYINNSYTIEFGIVKKVVAKGVVTVLVSTASNDTDVKVLTCSLITPYASSVMVDIIPKEGDKVIVFFPRKFNSDMFDIAKDDVILDKQSNGKTPFTGLAMLANQARPSDYKNYITVEDGKIEAKLAYSEDDDKNLVNLNIGSDGEISLSNDKADISMSKDGDISLSNDKAVISISKDGNILINAKDGKVSIKNNTAQMYKILKDTLTKLNTDMATQGSPASHTVVPNQFAQMLTDLDNLME